MNELPVAAIILAAGASSRFGRPKVVVDWKGQPLIANIVDIALRSPARPIVVVVGAHERQVRAALGSRPVQIIANANWQAGMSTSLQAGLAALPEVSGALFVLGDQPNITVQVLAALIARFRETGAPIIEPRWGDRPGNPALFARELFPELMQLSGDRGGRPLVNKYAKRVIAVQVDRLSILEDIDTQEDYQYQMSNITPHQPSQDYQALGRLHAVVSDMDGVLWRGSRPMPGLAEFFAFLRERNLPFILATNNATQSAAQYVEKLARFGVRVSEAEILTSSAVVAEYLKSIAPPGTRVFIVGSPVLADSIRASGLVVSQDEADIVVGGLDLTADYEKLAHAARLIRDGARFIGTNPDKSWPSETGETPGAGAFLAFLEAATGVAPFVVGKPQPVMFQQALGRLGTRPEETVMIGDRLETDVLGGHNAGLGTALMLSGVSAETDMERSGIYADWVFPNIGEMVAAWRRVIG